MYRRYLEKMATSKEENMDTSEPQTTENFIAKILAYFRNLPEEGIWVCAGTEFNELLESKKRMIEQFPNDMEEFKEDLSKNVNYKDSKLFTVLSHAMEKNSPMASKAFSEFHQLCFYQKKLAELEKHPEKKHVSKINVNQASNNGKDVAIEANIKQNTPVSPVIDKSKTYGGKESVKEMTQQNLSLSQINVSVPQGQLKEIKKPETMETEDKKVQKNEPNNANEAKEIIEKLRKENDRLSKSYEETKNNLDRKTAEIQKLESSNRSLTTSLSEAQSTINQLKQSEQNKVEEINAWKQHYQDIYTRLQNEQSLNAKVESENKTLKDQVDELTTRLSSFASKQLSEGNPNVADLSDQNRPTKIGEKFGSLYDDEWSEAFDILTNMEGKEDPERKEDDKKEENSQGNVLDKEQTPQNEGKEETNEEETIKLLVNILKIAYDFCSKTAKKQLEVLEDRMVKSMLHFEYKIPGSEQTMNTSCSMETSASIDASRKKYAKDYRKASAGSSVLGVCKMLRETELKETIEKLPKAEKEKLEAYIDKCTELIWYMVVQDPPMVLEIPEKGTKFNTNVFKHYKKKGKVVKLPVWPAVKLYENGGLISKGYALPE